jgi:hypothetical protein
MDFQAHCVLCISHQRWLRIFDWLSKYGSRMESSEKSLRLTLSIDTTFRQTYFDEQYLLKTYCVPEKENYITLKPKPMYINSILI